MKWDVEYTDEFGGWWGGLTEGEQESVRASVRLWGGEKTGKDRWYEEYVPIADRLYDEHLETLRKEGLKDGS